MKLSDYVAEFLASKGIEHVFGVTGGAVVHLFDSLEKTPGIQPIFNHHEQASALAAQSYARVRNGLGAAFFTTGPGGTNAITGVTAAWLDSIPVIYISGQTRLAHTTDGKSIRQYGNQQLHIVSLVEPITKYAVMVEDPSLIRYHLERAISEATSGRPGPVWIDIPLDVQWADLDPMTLVGYVKETSKNTHSDFDEKIEEVMSMLKSAHRPLVLAGYGTRLAGAEKELLQLVEELKIPLLTTWNTSDMIDGDNPLSMGRPGIFGQRGANLAVQNCDLLLSIGSHLSVPMTGSMFDSFAPAAKVIVVDIDPAELAHRRVRVDLAVRANAKKFLDTLLKKIKDEFTTDIQKWRDQCLTYKEKYNSISQDLWNKDDYVEPYVFMDALSDELNEKDIISVDGGGTTNQIAFQALRLKKGQRIAISAGLCSMGTGLPESIGLAFGSNRRRTICLSGDGSIQFNIQELQTVVQNKLPIKIFVFNNNGYLSIRQTQDGFLESNYVGSEPEGGLTLPDLQKLAHAYGISVSKIDNHNNLCENIRAVLESDEPVICEVMVDPNQEVTPRLGFDRHADGTGTPRPLEDMYPYLDREEFAANMVREQITKP